MTSIRLAAAVVAASLVVTTPALAQTIGRSQATKLNIHKATSAAVIAQSTRTTTRLERSSRPPQIFRSRASNKLSTGKRAAITALASLGGFLGGGFLGAAIEPGCQCDDPGLLGFVVGAPIGAASGGVLAWVLSGR